jgi:hypothetical protein
VYPRADRQGRRSATDTVRPVFIAFRLLKLAVKVALLLALTFVAFVAWGNFWPAPSHTPRTPCPPRQDGFRCVRVSGRVFFHTGFGPGRRAHVVLLSRSSVTLPGITSLEFPRLRSEPKGLGIGDWVAVAGQRVVGSHGEDDVHVWSFATNAISVRCADPVVAATCEQIRRR